MAYITGTTADIVEAQKSARSSLYGGKKWEEYFLQPTQQYYQEAGEAVQQQTAYDISQAYANYKQQELALLQQQQLGTGFKEQQASALQSQYGQVYSGLKSTELQNLMTVESQYQSALAKEEERLTKQATQYKKLDQAVQDFFEAYKGKGKLFRDVQSFDEFFDVDETGSKVLNERGKLFYEYALRGGDIDVSEYTEEGELVDEEQGVQLANFDEYLRERDEDLYEAYLNDPQFAQQVIGGLEYGDYSFEDERTEAEKISKDISIQEYRKEKEKDLSEKYDYDVALTPKFEDVEDKAKYLENYELHAKGNIPALGNNNKDDILKYLEDEFGNGAGRWSYGHREDYNSNYLQFEGTKLKNTDAKKLKEFANKYGVKIDVYNEGKENQHIILKFDTKMRAQDMAKALAAFSGTSFK